MSLFTVLATSKVAAGVLAAGAVAAGGTGVAAFNGALPTEIQQSAHDLVGAPAPAAEAVETAKTKASDAVESAEAKATNAADAGQAKAEDAVADAKSKAAAALKDATSPEAFGLCTAFLNGGLKADSKVPGFESLVVAAGGEAKVEAHCDAVVEAGKAAGLKADGSAKANVEAGTSVSSELPATPAVPAVPATPGIPAVPATPAVPAVPAVPSQVPTDVPALDAGLDSVR
ncbi:hypothetical protein ACIQC5_17730 [Paenarthrobacter sp. NPDC092416]|uniref:hypothetical protein n=1 Tax=Paenarthrobacter sp. NPDC092416 TaxID=3364386 RepID=UPI00380BD61B